MFCGKTCFVAIIFLIANLYTSLTGINEKDKHQFYKTLNDKQIELYENLVNERKNISMQGYVLGIIISIIVIVINMLMKNNLSNIPLICLIGSIAFVTNYLYYILSPKSTYMVLHLQNEEQKKQWLRIYRLMQYKFHSGLVFGIIAVIVMTMSICK